MVVTQNLRTGKERARAKSGRPAEEARSKGGSATMHMRSKEPCSSSHSTRRTLECVVKHSQCSNHLRAAQASLRGARPHVPVGQRRAKSVICFFLRDVHR